MSTFLDILPIDIIEYLVIILIKSYLYNTYTSTINIHNFFCSISNINSKLIYVSTLRQWLKHHKDCVFQRDCLCKYHKLKNSFEKIREHIYIMDGLSNRWICKQCNRIINRDVYIQVL